MTDTATGTETGVNATPDTEIKTFEGTIENFYGRPLSQLKFKEGFSPVTSIDFKGSYEHLKTFAAIPAKELPDQEDQLNMVNVARKANERQKAMQKALDAAGVIKPTMEDDDTLKVKSIVAGLVAARDAQGNKRYTEESATKLARQMLGLPVEG